VRFHGLVNPAAGVLAPAPGRLISLRIRRLEAVDRIRFFLSGRVAAHRPSLDIVLPLAVLSVVSVAGTVAAPLLRGNPLLLIALSPRLPFLLLAAPRIGLAPFVVIGTARLCLADPLHFRLGRRLAPTTDGGGWHRPGRWFARLAGHRLARPASGVAVALRPNGRNLALAGAVGLRAGLVAALDLGGTVLYLVALHGATGWFR
jgi:hypothetical protein